MECQVPEAVLAFEPSSCPLLALWLQGNELNSAASVGLDCFKDYLRDSMESEGTVPGRAAHWSVSAVVIIFCKPLSLAYTLVLGATALNKRVMFLAYMELTVKWEAWLFKDNKVYDLVNYSSSICYL